VTATSFVRPWASVEFTQTFAKRLALAPDEIRVLEEILSMARPVRRRQDIVTEGRPNRRFFIILEGLLIRYRITRDGHRQVINVVMPGDVAGTPSCFFDAALYSIRTLTNAVVAPMRVDTLSTLLDTQPRLAAKLFWLFSCDAALSAEHVVVVGRRSARERIAHFFLELLIRLQDIGQAEEASFEMPFSQDVICDALGLSLAYVNRELRMLAQEGLVVISKRKVVISDVKALSEIADFEHRYLKPSPPGEFFAPSSAVWNGPGRADRASPRKAASARAAL